MRVRIIGLVVILLLIGVAALLGYQNSARTTQLSADVYFAAWQLKEPVSVSLLLAITFAVGLFSGMVPMGIGWFGASRRAGRAESDAALNQKGSDW